MAAIQENSSLPSFDSFQLDHRLARALVKRSFTTPTEVQAAVIPLVLKGKDVLARSRTGSGKTLAYCIPVISCVLRLSASTEQSVSKPGALILIPTRELGRQVLAVVNGLMMYCGKTLSAANLAGEESLQLQKAMLDSDILISTPSRLLTHLENGNLVPKQLSILVIDEADLMLSFGYGADLKKLKTYLCSMTQTILMSATLSPDLEQLGHLLLSRPEIVDIVPKESADSQLTEYCIRCPKKEKYLVIFVILKLKLVAGKILIFVNDVSAGYKLKLFLEQFGIKSAIINGELPLNSRYHIMEEFNRGVYDIVIASDYINDYVGEDEPGNNDETNKINSNNKKRKADPEFGVSRGIDFQQVSAVINFDFPKNCTTYCHRIGRTARGNASGSALSFVSEKDEEIFAEVEEQQKTKKSIIHTYKFDMDLVEGFRYRVEDAMRKITKAAVKQARIKDIRLEILKSERLTAHWEVNPKDLEALRHDQVLLPSRIQPHMKHIPNYLMITRDKEKVKLPEKIAIPVPRGQKPAIGVKAQGKNHFGKQQHGKKKVDPLKKLTKK